MHFDATGFLINPGDVFGTVPSRSRLQFLVQPAQQIQIESCGHAEFVIVGGHATAPLGFSRSVPKSKQSPG